MNFFKQANSMLNPEHENTKRKLEEAKLLLNAALERIGEVAEELLEDKKTIEEKLKEIS